MERRWSAPSRARDHRLLGRPCSSQFFWPTAAGRIASTHASKPPERYTHRVRNNPLAFPTAYVVSRRRCCVMVPACRPARALSTGCACGVGYARPNGDDGAWPIHTLWAYNAN